MAGATEVLIGSSKRFALMHELRDAPEPPLRELLARLAPVDLVIVEGYKQEPHPKVEVPSRLQAASRSALVRTIPGSWRSSLPISRFQLAPSCRSSGLDDIDTIAARAAGQDRIPLDQVL